MFFEHTGIKPESNNRNINGISLNSWNPTKTFLNDSWVKEEDSREIKDKLNLNKNKTIAWNLWLQLSSFEREIYSVKHYIIEEEKHPIGNISQISRT